MYAWYQNLDNEILHFI